MSSSFASFFFPPYTMPASELNPVLARNFLDSDESKQA
jgi:hypothetical protein